MLNPQDILSLLQQSVDKLPRTSPITIRKLKNLEIQTFSDLLEYFPSRYENYSLISNIQNLQEGELVTVKGIIEQASNVYTKKGLKIQKVTIRDDTGKVEIAWYNQPYLLTVLKKGLTLSVAGEVKRYLHTYTVEPREYEVLPSPNQTTIHTGRIVPMYPEKKGLSTKTIREKIYRVIEMIKEYPSSALEWLPSQITSFNNLVSEFDAIREVHFPQTTHSALSAKRRLSFDELFTIQLSSALIRKEWKKEVVRNPYVMNELHKKKLYEFIARLPFVLTRAQQKVFDDILHDLTQPNPMNRFIQGDVGSGKTVVAALAAYISYLNGYQSLCMAPTEILTLQHFSTFLKLFQNTAVKVGLMTSSQKSTKKEPSENFDIMVGTQAFLNQSLRFDRVGLVIIDEQHRFGVAQRAQLKQKGMNPHLLTMTATPIPRTVALTLYGELELSVIDELPKGRIPIKTYLVPSVKRTSGYNWMKKQIETHDSQIFIICPLIEESEHETLTSVKAAKKEYEFLKNEIFTNFNVGLLHGKMKAKEKEQMMNDFKKKKYHILVSTSVVEVGVDVPNATIIVIEGAERYGLAQLHQLRGRVGRGIKQSYCLLFTSSQENNSTHRLKFFANTMSGIQLAEFDFKIRGPGDIFGTSQHGYNRLKIADLGDIPLIEQTKHAVGYFIKHFSIDTFPAIQKRINTFRIQQITRD